MQFICPRRLTRASFVRCSKKGAEAYSEAAEGWLRVGDQLNDHNGAAALRGPGLSVLYHFLWDAFYYALVHGECDLEKQE